MFIRKNASSEIESSMEEYFVKSAVANKEEKLNKFAIAVDYLNVVAEIFDDIGLTGEAEATTQLLEVVAGKKKKTPKSKKSPGKKNDVAIKGLDSKKMVKNLEEKGWMFNADDAHEKHDDDCMCSGCMDVDEANYQKKRNHGSDCVCEPCMSDNNDASDTNYHFHTDTSPARLGEDENYTTEDYTEMFKDLFER